MPNASTRRFRRGERVRCLHDPDMGVGRISSLGTETMVIYLGQNEWMAEYAPFASVSFDTGECQIPIKELVRDRSVRLYESLRPGDLLVVGRVKQSRVLVMGVVKRRRTGRQYVTPARVVILEDGMKRSLSVKQDVKVIQRMTDD